MMTLHHKIALWIFGIFPQILLVALCNSRAMGEANENADIDLFIITQSGKLWTVRLLTTAISSLLGVRRKNTHGLSKGSPEYIKKTRNKFCLSFFITEDAMDLSPIRLQPNDPYLDRWIKTLTPLVNKDTTLERFLEVNKSSVIIHSSLFIRHSMLEKWIKNLWLPHTLKSCNKLGKPWGIVISDTMLKFHDNDQRKVYSDLHK